MLENIIFFFIISSGSAFAASFFKIKYELVQPITIGAMVLVLYFSGLVGNLMLGFYIATAFAITLWILAMIPLIKLLCSNKVRFVIEIRKTAKVFVSEGFFLMLIIYIVLNYALKGMMVHNWDEYAHWAAVVKEMVIENSLSTRTSMQLTASNYPPGMSLFQYYLQVLFQLMNHIGSDSLQGEYARAAWFSEWRLYLAYMVLVLSFLVPVISKIARYYINAGIRCVALIYMIFLVIPLGFFYHFYHNIYIDAFLGIMCGVGISMTALVKTSNLENDKYEDLLLLLYLMSACFIVSISKSSGILFAAIIFLYYVKQYFNYDVVFARKSIFLFLSMILPWLTWNVEVSKSEKQFTNSNPISLKVFFELLKGNGEQYRISILNNFGKALFGKSDPVYVYVIGNTNIEVIYFNVLLLFALISFVSLLYVRKCNMEWYKVFKSAILLSFLQWAIFYIGLLFTYLFKFSVEQGTSLSSYARFNSTTFLGLQIVVMSLLLRALAEYASHGKGRASVIAIVFMAVLLLCPSSSIYTLLSREDVNKSVETNSAYATVIQKIRNLEGENRKRVYVIDQEIQFYKSGAASLATYLRILPDMANYSENPFVLSNEKQDWYIADYNPDEWMDILCDSYDYLALYNIDDYFVNKYGKLFENEADILPNSIYEIDRYNKKLKLIW